MFSSSVRSAEYYIGYALDADTALIGVLGGVDRDYIVNMDEFYAIPAENGYIWLKVDMPDTAEGVIVKRSTTAYDDTGIAWGDLVANITDDSSYHGANGWLKDNDFGSGLSNGTLYYYKAFPYLGSVYNILAGDNDENIGQAKAGGGWSHLSMDNVLGSTIVDEWYASNATNVNGTFGTGEQGNCWQGNGVNAKVQLVNTYSSFLPGNWTMAFRFKPTSGTDIVAFQYNASIYVEWYSSGAIKLYVNGKRYLETSAKFMADSWYTVIITRSTSNGLVIRVNGAEEDTDPFTGSVGSITAQNALATNYNDSAIADHDIDDWFIWNRVLESYEIASIETLFESVA